MKRRTFLKGTAGAAGLTSLSGCASFLDGDGGGDEPQDGYKAGDEDDPVDYAPSETNARRVDFIDNTGALGHVAHQDVDDYEGRPVEYENDHSEANFQEMSDNDIQRARRYLNENDSSIDEIRTFVESEIEESPQGESDERALVRGIGKGINSETLIGSSLETSHVIKPLAETFAEELSLDENFEAWITGSTIPLTEGRFAHSLLTISYQEDGELVRDYVEPALPDTPGLGDSGDEAVRRPESSVYSDPEGLEYLGGYEFSKMIDAAREGLVAQEDSMHPMHAVSLGLVGHFRKMIDTATNDINLDYQPPNGWNVAVTPEFGNSVEEAFYENWNENTKQKMENIGRAMQTFYEEEGGEGYLGFSSTLEEPELYEFSARDGVQAAWDTALEEGSVDFENL